MTPPGQVTAAAVDTAPPTPARREPIRLRFRTDIEGLRGIAIGLGVAGHLFEDYGASWAFHAIPAMDIFFTMSGFLITSLLILEYERNADEKRRKKQRAIGTISLRSFYERRARRIFPAALVTIAVTLLISKLVFNSLRFSEVQADALWSTFWVENFNLISKSANYFAMGDVASPFQHYWSLAVEEQFYLFWPALFLIATKLTFLRGKPLMAGGNWPQRIVAVAAAVAIPSFIVCVITSFDNPQAAYFSTFNRAWIVLIGAIAATVPRLRAGLSDRNSKLASWAGAGLLIAGLMLADRGTPYPGVTGLLPALGTMLILLAGVREEPRTLVTALLDSRPVRFTGRISYSLYLWHWPIIVFAVVLIPKSDLSGIPRVLVLGAFSFAVAWLSFTFIEQPFLMVKRVYQSSKDAMGRWMGTARTNLQLGVLASVGVVTIATIGLYARPATGTASAPEAAWVAWASGAAISGSGGSIDMGIASDKWDLARDQGAKEITATPAEINEAGKKTANSPYTGCFTIMTMKKAEACSIEGYNSSSVKWPTGMPPTVALVGWSAAAQFRETLAAVLPPGVKVIPFTAAECDAANGTGVHLTTVEGVDCGDHNAFAQAAVAKLRPGLTVISLDVNKGQRAEQTLKLYGGVSSRTLLLGAYPMMPPFESCIHADQVGDCFAPLPNKGIFINDAASAASESSRIASSAGASLLQNADRLCLLKENRCPSFIAGKPVLWDGKHFTSDTLKNYRSVLAKAIQSALDQ